MKKLFSLTLLLIPAIASATQPMEDAFLTYSLSRKYEAQIEALISQADLSPSDRAIQEKQIGASLTEARIAFHSILRGDRSKLDEWEREMISKVAKGQATGAKELNSAHLSFLEESFPGAATFSAMEWKVIGEWFGKPTQEAFLRSSFHAQGFPLQAKADAKKPILFVVDPLDFKLEKMPAAALAWKKAGHEVEVLRLSAFTQADDLAEELRRNLSSRLEKKFLLVTEGNAGGIFLRALDLTPALRRQANILGWVNVNGILYGSEPKAGRSLASEKAKGRRDLEVQKGLEALRFEGFERPTPLGDGFPIWNLVSENKSKREALVTDGQTYILENGSALEKAAVFTADPSGI
jgi:hypothetical protein